MEYKDTTGNDMEDVTDSIGEVHLSSNAAVQVTASELERLFAEERASIKVLQHQFEEGEITFKELMRLLSLQRAKLREEIELFKAGKNITTAAAAGGSGSDGGNESEDALPSSTFSKILDHSASTIALTHRHLYDVFTPPCVGNVFIPNRRLRLLRDQFQTLSSSMVKGDTSLKESVSYTAMRLDDSLVLQQVLGYPKKESERWVSDPNIQNYVNCICERANALLKYKECLFETGKENISWNENFILASTLTKPEYFIRDLKSKCIVLGTAAKDNESSLFTALPQFLQLCGDSALQLRRYGLATKDCVVPGVIAVGETFQISAVYLIPDHFPVLVNLSSSIHISDTLTLSIWAEALAMFVNETLALIQSSNTNANKKTITIEECKLASGYFFKPIWFDENNLFSVGDYWVSNQRNVLHRMMNIYERLFLCTTETNPVEDVIQFPLGVISAPSPENPHATSIRKVIEKCVRKHFGQFPIDHLTYAPCLIFPYLSDKSMWTNERPESKYVDSYLKQLSRAVEILNSAGVVHMDLRPPNIMWRACVREGGGMGGGEGGGEGGGKVESNEVEIQVIDFGDALLVGQQIPEGLVDIYSNDPRYPITHEMADEEFVLAKTDFNDFFLHAITAWLKESEYETQFTSFMWKFNKRL